MAREALSWTYGGCKLARLMADIPLEIAFIIR